MPLFGLRRTPVPRLAPELDDVELGRLLKQILAPRIPGHLELSAGLVEQLLTETGPDWDRRAHRFAVLAEATSPVLAQVWRRQQPKNPDALILHSWAEVADARHRGALADPAATIDRCRRAAELRPDDPTPWVVILAAHRLLRRPEAEVVPVCREIGARDPWNRTAHLQMLRYLSPDECGSHAQVLDFVDAVRSAAPADSPVAGLELAMLLDRYRSAVSAGGVTALSARRRWARPDAEAALDRAAAHWPKAGYLRHAGALADLNVLAYALVHANRAREAADVFPAIGATVTAWPWALDGDPLQQFGYWRTQIGDGHGPLG